MAVVVAQLETRRDCDEIVVAVGLESSSKRRKEKRFEASVVVAVAAKLDSLDQPD